MKRLLLILAACLTVVAGCKGGGKKPASGEAAGNGETVETAAKKAPAATGKDFTFDELYKIFCCFGDNVMTKAFASQRIKDEIKDELQGAFDSSVEFLGPRNAISFDRFDGNCYDGFQMACYRYKADDHVLVVLLENGGCDVSSVKYIRFYEYDPATGNAREVPTPFDPEPERDDFEDMVRLAGSDVQALRDAMRAGLYDYEFRPEGVTVRLNDPMDYDEAVYHGDLVVNYLWNGSELVRDEDYRYRCIHPDGFASIKLGEPAPDFRFDYDPKDYDVVYSSGGDLWIIGLDGKDGLQVQMDGGVVYSIEIWFPEYRVASYAYDPGKGKELPYVGGRINDCINFEEDAPQVTMLMDGTVQIVVESWTSKIAFRTSQQSLATAVKPSMDGPFTIENPKFKPDARIESILVWRE